MDSESKIRLFTVANSLAEDALDKVESTLDIDLYRKEEETIQEKGYYAQFEADFRKEAKEMSNHYEMFYCLERSIRSLITELMMENFGNNWWEEKIDEVTKNNAEDNIKKEIDSGYTQRSSEKIDYTTFGELNKIVTSNWEAFDDLFGSQRAFQKIMTNLNLLRSPIAHCCPLAEDEVVRLELAVKDGFRLIT